MTLNRTHSFMVSFNRARFTEAGCFAVENRQV